MNDIFLPRGDQSESERLVGLMVDTPVDGVMTYEAMDRALGRDFRESRSVFGVALERFHREHPERGTFVNERNIGYRRVVELPDTAGMAHRRRKRAKRQLRKAKAVLLSTDRTTLTGTQGEELLGLVERMGRLEREVAITRRHVAQAHSLAQAAHELAAENERRQAEMEETIRETVRQEIAAQIEAARA